MLADVPIYESAGWHVAEFAETFCRHTKGRWARRAEMLILEDWQRVFVDEAFRLDENGERVYTTVLLGIPRKNGKSTLAAAIALYLAVADGEHGPEVILAAGSGDQASIVFDQARAFVDESQDLLDSLDPRRYIIRLRSGHGFIKRVSADGRLQHGLNPSGVVFDELHSVTTPRQEELYSAMTTGDAAREQPFSLFITTAGFDKETVLGKLYDAALASPTAEITKRPGLTIARDPEARFLMYWYGLDEATDDLTDPVILKLANPASWVTVDYLSGKIASPTVSDADLKRLHANAWTTTDESWFAGGVWTGLKRDGITDGSPIIPEGSDVYVGVDVGITHDSTAVAIASLDGSSGRDLTSIEARVFAAQLGVIAHEHMEGGRIDLDHVREYIEGLATRYRVIAVAYDPRFFEGPAQTLAKAGFTVAPIDQAGNIMPAAAQSFYQAVVEHKLEHNGDPILTAHVAATMGSMTERGWRLEKLDRTRGRKRQRKIDGLIASVIAHYFAAKPTAFLSNPYEKRGVRTV